MRFSRQVHAIDTHTEGMPTRIVTGGVGALPGDSTAARRRYLLEHMDDFRTFLMCEPRGHAAMAGALLQPPILPEADFGVVYMDAEGSVPVCGHGAMGVAMALVETGMVEVREPVTTVRLDTPAGLVTADVEVEDGRTRRVSVTGVPSFVLGRDLRVDVPGFGAIAYDLVYGGNHCAVLDLAQLGLPFDLKARKEILAAGLAVVAAVAATGEFTHPSGAPATLRHAQLLAPDASGTRSRHAMVISPGWFDRSPCGTGTAGRMAQLHARGELALDTDFVNESFLGTRFTGRLLGETTVDGVAAVVPRISGRAWITGTAQYSLDPDDVLAAGFLL
ncbi:proline racemase family protein [Umezawaea sp. Da 62-37]|uniref:proline racemase family protein n=1 Tax=Umezawaea sp. Da 62-37 TaxID=3075927 RepID=UPI0028F6FEA0|nr:proline racemase family protein [Umezawaea sp. Da 62-37]WNV85654.1 proline racemase family protein [Umezawaea sp. Da 62-37]